MQQWAKTDEGRMWMEDGADPHSCILAVADDEEVHCSTCTRLFTRPDQIDLILTATWHDAEGYISFEASEVYCTICVTTHGVDCAGGLEQQLCLRHDPSTTP
jgi:hypothetical protein